MQRLLLSLAVIVAVGGGVAASTGAFFSDVETSTGNTLAAGAIDLGIDNHGYMNGNECVNIGTQQAQNYVWQGPASYPVPGTPCNETWHVDYDLSDDLIPHQFFNFNDIKPGDWGEDTISFHVNNNDSWLCADVTITADDDVSSVDPELDEGDAPEVPADQWDGELAGHIRWYWWADDGDNVYEEGERSLPGSGGTFNNPTATTTYNVILADSTQNIWTNIPDDPLDPADVRFVGKAWCFGDGTLTPYSQDGGNQGFGPDVRPMTCDGEDETNITQTDRMMVDIAFRAVQSRNNDNFQCIPQEQSVVQTITVNKVLVTEGDTTDEDTLPVVGDFAPYLVDATPVTLGVATAFVAGAHVVSETNIDPDYNMTFSGDCSVIDGSITLGVGENLACTITNTFDGEDNDE